MDDYYSLTEKLSWNYMKFYSYIAYVSEKHKYYFLPRIPTTTQVESRAKAIVLYLFIFIEYIIQNNT